MVAIQLSKRRGMVTKEDRNLKFYTRNMQRPEKLFVNGISKYLGIAKIELIN